MPDYSFLPHFIEEEIYLIKDDSVKLAETAAPAPEKEEQVVAAPVPALVVETPAEAPQVQEPEPVYLKPLPTEGNNLKHCLVLVESEEKVLEAELKGLLQKIMGAVKRGPDDVLLVNVREAESEQLEALLTEQNHRHLLAFGTTKVSQLSGAGNYEITEVNKKYYLKADSLTAISQNVELKKALWGALKGMF